MPKNQKKKIVKPSSIKARKPELNAQKNTFYFSRKTRKNNQAFYVDTMLQVDH